MNTIIRTLTAATLAIALVGTTVALTSSSAEAGPKIPDGKGVTASSLGSGR